MAEVAPSVAVVRPMGQAEQPVEDARLADKPSVPTGHFRAHPEKSAASILPVRGDHCPRRHSQGSGVTEMTKAVAVEWLRNVVSATNEEAAELDWK